MNIKKLRADLCRITSHNLFVYLFLIEYTKIIKGGAITTFDYYSRPTDNSFENYRFTSIFEVKTSEHKNAMNILTL